VTCMDKKPNAYSDLVVMMPEGKDHLENAGTYWRIRLTWILKTGCVSVEWIHLAKI